MQICKVNISHIQTGNIRHPAKIIHDCPSFKIDNNVAFSPLKYPALSSSSLRFNGGLPCIQERYITAIFWILLLRCFTLLSSAHAPFVPGFMANYTPISRSRHFEIESEAPVGRNPEVLPLITGAAMSYCCVPGCTSYQRK